MSIRVFISCLLISFFLISCSSKGVVKKDLSPSKSGTALLQPKSDNASTNSEKDILRRLVLKEDNDKSDAVVQTRPIISATTSKTNALPNISIANSPSVQGVSDLKATSTRANLPENQMLLNFEDADLRSVIAAIAEMLNINYVISPSISGKITVRSYKKFDFSNLFSIFQILLETNSLTAVKDGLVYKIIQMDTAKQQSVDVKSGKKEPLTIDSTFITQIIPIQNMKATEFMNLVKNLMPKGADMVVYEPSNIIILTAPPSAISKFIKILEIVDIPSEYRQTMKPFIYYTENRDAKKLAEVLKNIYPEDKSKMQTPDKMQTSTDSIQGKMGDVKIIVFDDINAIIMKCSSADYLLMLETLKQLDIPEKQVLIEVVIAEVILNDSNQMGVEWLLRSRIGEKGQSLSGVNTSIDSTVIGSKIDPTTGQVGSIITTPVASGLYSAIIDPNKYGVIINAFSGIGTVNILASPRILAVNNVEAKIEVGAEIPVATGFQQQTTAAATAGSFLTAGQIQYRTTGTILSVKPTISEKNMVKLKITQEISSQSADISISGLASPSFSKRRAETVGIVLSGNTLMIGGLLSEETKTSKEGIPILSKIPILGYLFGVTSVTTKKVELILLVTPHIIDATIESDEIKNRFGNKIRTIEKRIDDLETSNFMNIEK